jgi:hypothetical protein
LLLSILEMGENIPLLYAYKTLPISPKPTLQKSEPSYQNIHLTSQDISPIPSHHDITLV